VICVFTERVGGRDGVGGGDVCGIVVLYSVCVCVCAVLFVCSVECNVASHTTPRLSRPIVSVEN
jgi:hypothetical protein